MSPRTTFIYHSYAISWMCPRTTFYILIRCYILVVSQDYIWYIITLLYFRCVTVTHFIYHSSWMCLRTTFYISLIWYILDVSQDHIWYIINLLYLDVSQDHILYITQMIYLGCVPGPHLIYHSYDISWMCPRTTFDISFICYI